MKVMEYKVFRNRIPGADGTVCVLLYGYVGEGDEVDAGRVVAELGELQRQYGRIDVRINSMGGEVFAGLAIANALRTCPSQVDIYVDGVAASIAGVIALCGRPLHMSSFSRLMLHRVSGGAYGTADDMKSSARLMEELETTLCEVMARKCSLEPEAVRERYFDGREHWITAAQAKEMGLADSVYDMQGSERMPQEPTARQVYEFTNRLQTGVQHNNNEDMLIDELKKRPGFANVQDEAQALSQVAALENQAAKVPALENRVKEMADEVSRMRNAANESLLEEAVSSGRITQQQRNLYAKLLESDHENTKALLESMPARSRRIEDYIGGAAGGGEDLAGMSWDEIDRAERLAELKDKFPALYARKYNEKFGRKG